jgi:hypothetical protein
MKNGISWSKTGFRKYGQTNAPPFLVPLPFYFVPFLFIPEKQKRTEKYGIRLQTKWDLSCPFSTLDIRTVWFGSVLATPCVCRRAKEYKFVCFFEKEYKFVKLVGYMQVGQRVRKSSGLNDRTGDTRRTACGKHGRPCAGTRAKARCVPTREAAARSVRKQVRY